MRSAMCWLLNRLQLKLETRFARRLGQRLDPAVIKKAVAIEDHLPDTLVQASGGDALADRPGRVEVARGFKSAAHVRRQRGRRRQRTARIVRNYLCVNMMQRAVDRKPRYLVAAAHLAPHPGLTRRAFFHPL